MVVEILWCEALSAETYFYDVVHGNVHKRVDQVGIGAKTNTARSKKHRKATALLSNGRGQRAGFVDHDDF